MFRPRFIPVLLLKGSTLVKTEQFGKPTYIGDPINAVKIFNDLKADELVFLDIDASRENRLPNLELIKNVAEEANMPFSVGGGIKTIQDIRQLIQAGAEKIIIGTNAVKNPFFIKEASSEFGSSTITVCIDVKKSFFGGEKVYISNGSKKTNFTPLDFAILMEQYGAGEIIIQSIQKDGTRTGYDEQIIEQIANKLNIPIVALGGAADINNMKQLHIKTRISGLAAGSIFVFQGKKKGVLINYPEKIEKQIETRDY